MAATLVVGLSACGSESLVTGSTVPAAPVVIEVAGTGSANPSPAAAMEADTKMMPMSITYVYDGEQLDLTGPAASWFFAPGAVPTADEVLAVATAFGVAGEVRELPADQGGGWIVGSDDYSEASVRVGTDAVTSWWYNAPASAFGPAAEPCEVTETDPAAAPDSIPTTDPAGEALPRCEEPQPPSGVPTAAEAEARARAMLTALGLDPAGYRFETYADEWGAGVTAYLLVEGIETNLSVSVGYGAEGVVTWAGGFLAEPQRGADYPRIGIDAAITRMNDQSGWLYGVSARGVIDAGVAVDTEVATANETAAAPPAGDADDTTVPATDVLVDPPIDCSDAATDCMPVDLEPITVTLSGARPSLEQVWAADGTVWLLPGYAFDAADGGRYTALAVEDQYLQIAEPPVDSVPVESLPVDTGATPEPAPAPAPEPGDPGSDGTDVPAAIDVVGLTVDEASRIASETGWSIRVVREDGADLAVTADYSETRINVATEAGIVTEVLSIG